MVAQAAAEAVKQRGIPLNWKGCWADAGTEI